MGVYHLSGLGLSPGGVTVPLSYIYLLLRATYKYNIKVASELFMSSGEENNSKETCKGAPEALVIFTSKLVIEGQVENLNVKSKWFNLGSIKVKRIPAIICKFFNRLFDELKSENLTEIPQKFKRIYFIEVNYQDYHDCYYKVGVTMKALRDKEVWVNMIGGSNQINAALLFAGTLYSVPSIYYYIFQRDITLLHPEILPSFPKEMTESIVELLLNNWNELPFFNISMGFIDELNNMFLEGNGKITKEKLVGIIKKYNILPVKLRRLFIIDKVRGIAYPSMFFKNIVELKERVDKENIKNISEWKAWGKQLGILRELKVYDGVIDCNIT